MNGAIELTDNKSEKIDYDYSDYPFYVRKNILSHYPDFRAPNHWHDAVELTAVISGEMDYNVNGRTLHMRSDEGIVVNSVQMHFGYSEQKTDCEFICIILHPMVLCSIPSFGHDFIHPFISNAQVPYVSLSPNCLWQKEIYDRIISIYKNRQTETAPLRILSEFSAIWTLLYENMPSDDQKKLRRNRDLFIVKDMVSFIQNNYTEKITLSDIARSGSVGESKCYKLFLKYFSQSPNVYLNQYRLNKSIVLLQTTDMPVIEIALSVGFSGASYFSETFRKWTGKSPTRFRRDFPRIQEQRVPLAELSRRARSL